MLSPECNAYAEQLTAAIKNAGWETLHSPMAAVGFRGIRVVANGNVEDTADVVQAAFAKAGITYSNEPVNIAECPIQHSPSVYVFIGEKP
jgi:hypothetical protein